MHQRERTGGEISGSGTENAELLSLLARVLHRAAFTQRSFTQRSFDTEDLLHTEACVHRDDFTHKIFYTEKLLHSKGFTRKSLYTQRL